MATDTGNLGVVNKVNGVGHTRVLRNARIVKVHNMGPLVVDHVFQDRAETDGVVDLGLLLCRQTDGLGIATALDVEDAIVGPAMFIIAYQMAIGVSREGRLSGP